ncbi:MAG: nitroreductase family protein [Planctomycetota bacterium]|jgi:nitroreductase
MARPVHEKLDSIFSRYSCRKFRKDPVDPEDLKIFRKILRWAPSAGNAQPWIFYEILDEKVRKVLAAAAFDQLFIAQAPVVYAICADPAEAERAYGHRGETLYMLQDTAAATMSLLIAANALGYGTCWVGAFDEKRVAGILDLDKGLRPVALVPLGRPDEPDQCPGRKAEARIFRFIK